MSTLRRSSLNRMYAFFALALGVLIAGLTMTPDGILDFLVPHLESERLVMIRPGAVFLKILIVIDGVLLLGLALLWRKPVPDERKYESMWIGRQSSTPAVLDDHFTSIMVVLLLFAIALRVAGLNSGLWMDEVFTLVSSVRPSYGEVFAIYASDNQHTLYSLLAKICVGIFGENPWSLRIPALAFGVASIWAAARVARLTFGVREALLTALFCAVSYHHIWFSQNARGYTILLFVALISTDCLLRGLKTGQWRYWLGYSVAIALGAFAHLTAIFLALAHALVVFAVLIKNGQLKKTCWKPVCSFVLAAWLTLHLYALVIPQMARFFAEQSDSASQVSVDWQSPLWLVTEAFKQVGINAYDWWPLLIAAFLLACWVGYLFIRRDWIFTLAAFLPAVLLAIVLVALDRNLWPRMFFSQLGFIVLFFFTTLVAAGDYLRNRWIGESPMANIGSVALPSVLVIVAATSMLPGLYQFPKQDYQAARNYVQQSAAPGDTILGLHMAGRVYELYYAPEWPAVDSVEQLLQQRSSTGSTWVLYTLPSFIRNAKPDLAALLEKDFEIVKVFPGSLNDGEIIVTRSKTQYLENQ